MLVTEVVTDENGNKKTVVTKKSSSEVSKNDAVASTSPVSNKGTVNSSSNSSVSKQQQTVVHQNHLEITQAVQTVVTIHLHLKEMNISITIIFQLRKQYIMML